MDSSGGESLPVPEGSGSPTTVTAYIGASGVDPPEVDDMSYLLTIGDKTEHLVEYEIRPSARLPVATSSR